jgi:hypothetical protein
MKATRDNCSSGSNSREPVVVPDLTAGAVRNFQDTARLGGLVRVTLLVGLISFLACGYLVSVRGCDLCDRWRKSEFAMSSLANLFKVEDVHLRRWLLVAFLGGGCAFSIVCCCVCGGVSSLFVLACVAVLFGASGWFCFLLSLCFLSRFAFGRGCVGWSEDNLVALFSILFHYFIFP